MVAALDSVICCSILFALFWFSCVQVLSIFTILLFFSTIFIIAILVTFSYEVAPLPSLSFAPHMQVSFISFCWVLFAIMTIFELFIRFICFDALFITFIIWFQVVSALLSLVLLFCTFNHCRNPYDWGFVSISASISFWIRFLCFMFHFNFIIIAGWSFAKRLKFHWFRYFLSLAIYLLYWCMFLHLCWQFWWF